MFSTILIANRGEIARRIIRSCKRLGIKSIAVYSDADAASPHVREADEAYNIGPAQASQSYLNIEKILEVAISAKADAIHPGYGFLSENSHFASEVESLGMAFIGPSVQQLNDFGIKHTARALAEMAGVPLLPGTGLLENAEEAATAAQRIGFPVMLKASNGGGGIGMQACENPDDVRVAFERVQRLAVNNFGEGGVFLERYVNPARHIEVQIFGDGDGNVAIFGDRDCSLQRRNQKVIEEAPAPDLPDNVRTSIHEASLLLARSVNYRSAGTVEYIYDPIRKEAYFLEVNTRLQVEHPVTELVFGIDLVELMIQQAQGTLAPAIFTKEFIPGGVAIEARIYAEDPGKGNTPSSGLITNVELFGENQSPESGVRVDSWIEAGSEVSLHYDPLLAKVITFNETRAQTLEDAYKALSQSRIDGIVTNIGLVRELMHDPSFSKNIHSTSTLAKTEDPDPRIEVLVPGLLTTVQDIQGRIGYWQVGVPPSGAMDSLSLKLANNALGNDENAAGLECTANGPTLRFSTETEVCITGAPVTCLLDENEVRQWEPIKVPAGGTLSIGEVSGPGLRVYLAIQGGLDVPLYLGSKSTFTLGQFGGHGGRPLKVGDVLRPTRNNTQKNSKAIEESQRPTFTNEWQIAVTEGPHEAPEYFRFEDIEEFYSAEYKVHLNSARTGVRLIGPKPRWAREDGGEAGLHPSNIHDNAYALGAIDFTGDTPIILGPDGPSLGGFVCPAVVASGERWKLGQISPGDTIRFIPVLERDAAAIHVAGFEKTDHKGDGDHGVIKHIANRGHRPSITFRRAGDTNLLIEYGEMVLDIGLRMRVHALFTELSSSNIPGITDLTPGIRSLQVQIDPSILLPSQLVAQIEQIDNDIPPTEELRVPSRRVRLPLSWDDPSTRLAIERYMSGVRDDAPWCPWNIEFIRRVNGLKSVDDVYDIVFNASYLVMGLGDVYLGAPVATPLDPRHRLVTTKYNPARTWTPENAVGIGGAYLCVYGMEGPGGYQFVGRTTQMWNRFRKGGLFNEKPWALRFFDRIEFYPVTSDDLTNLRELTAAGLGPYEVEEGEFSYAEYLDFLNTNASEIEQFRKTQHSAFDAEKEMWRESGEFEAKEEVIVEAQTGTIEIPEDCEGVFAPITATLWQSNVEIGDLVSTGDQLVSLEAMKMETPLLAPLSGTVAHIYAIPGSVVSQGQPIIAIKPSD